MKFTLRHQTLSHQRIMIARQHARLESALEIHLLLTSTSMPRHIAPEIVDLILRNIAVSSEYGVDICVSETSYEDQRTLANCSLVSRSWTPVAQALLFRNFTLHLSFGDGGPTMFFNQH